MDAARHEVDFAVAFFGQAVRQQAEIIEDVPGGLALMHQVVNGKDRGDVAVPIDVLPAVLSHVIAGAACQSWALTTSGRQSIARMSSSAARLKNAKR